jgi:tetratricopeptide (TPR) repeat protein
MGRLLVSCKQQLEAAADPRAAQLIIPPVFDNCSCILTEQDQQAARDLYWEVVSDTQLQGPQHAQQAGEKLQRVITLNPWVPEPRLMLAQLHIHAKEWAAAIEAAAAALKLFVQWGTAWDKRMPWDAWVSAMLKAIAFRLQCSSCR